MNDAKLEIILSAKDMTAKTLRTFQGRITAITKSVFSLQGGLVTLAGGAGLGALTKSLFEAGKSMAQLEKSYAAITGSAEAAGAEFAWLRDTSDDLGQNFYDLAGAYKTFLAASREANTSAEETRRIFRAVTSASASLGLSSDDTRGALKAIEQSMSKGKVMAEELRQQLGERLPGAFGMMAKALGVTTGELNKMLEQGQVGSEAWSKFADVLERRYTGAVDDAVRASNKWDEAWTDLRTNMAQSGFLDSAASAMMDISATLKDPNVQQGLRDFAKNLGAVVENMAKLAKYAGVRSVTGTFGQAVELSNQGLLDLTEFARMGFVERQRLVDDILAKQQQINTGAAFATGGMIGDYSAPTPLGLGQAAPKPLKPISGKPAAFDYSLTGTGYLSDAPSIGGVLDPSQLDRAWTDTTVKIEESMAQATRITYGAAEASQNAWTQAFDNMGGAFTGWASSYSAELTDMIWESDFSFKKIAESFGRMLTQMGIQMAMSGIFKMFGGALSGGFSSLLGGGMNTGKPIHLGAGGTTAFGMASGGYLGEGVVGIGTRSGSSYEFHPNEFVVPADKMGGGSGPTVINNNTFNVQALDVKSFEKAYGSAVTNVVNDNLSRQGSLRSNVRMAAR